MTVNNNFIDIDEEKLIDWNEPNGECYTVSDKITKEGYKVGYMIRKQPVKDTPDSGWMFIAGNEDEKYLNNEDNFHIFPLNTVCNYDKDIIPYLKSDIGSIYIRINESEFKQSNNKDSIFISKQKR